MVGITNVSDIKTASIEWLKSPAAIVRIHDEGGVYGDPYDWSCTIEAIGDLAIFRATLTAPTQSGFRALQNAMKKAGFKKARWIRIDGRERNWEIK